MAYNRLWKYGLSLLIGIVWTGFCAGCGSDVFEPWRTPSGDAPRRSLTFSFGAIHQTYVDIYAEPSVGSERLTQCIYGDVVRIEDETPWWYFVKVGPYSELSGWIHKSGVTLLKADGQYLKERSIKTIVIRQDKTQVFAWPSQTLDLVMGTELPFIGESGNWYLVRLPSNDVGKIMREAVFPSSLEEPLIHAPQIVAESPQASSSMDSAAAPTPVPVAPPGKTPPRFVPPHRQHIIATAERFLGKVYIWGGTTPRGFDCSGLTYFVYKLNGVELPRVSWLQFRTKIGKKIDRSQLQEGDLVFFQTYKPGPSHVGIYVGNNRFIHASPTYGVTISNLNEPYFKHRYIGAKAVLSAS